MLRSIYLFLNICSLLVFIFGTQNLVAESYHKYNRFYSCDYALIMLHMLSKAIVCLKFLIMSKIFLIIFLNIRFGMVDLYIFYEYIKLSLYICDYILYRNLDDKKYFYKLSTYLFGFISLGSIIFLSLSLFLKSMAENEFFILTEIDSTMMFILLLYLKYETRELG